MAFRNLRNNVKNQPHQAEKRLEPDPLWVRLMNAAQRKTLAELLQNSFVNLDVSNILVSDAGRQSRVGEMRRVARVSAKKQYASGARHLMTATKEALFRSGCASMSRSEKPPTIMDSALSIDFKEVTKLVLGNGSLGTEDAHAWSLRAAFNSWWLHVHAQDPVSHAIEAVSERVYVAVMTQIMELLCLVHTSIPLEDVAAMDFKFDAEGRPRLPRKGFFRVLFSLSCFWAPDRRGSWTSDEAMSHHVKFFEQLLAAVRNPDGVPQLESFTRAGRGLTKPAQEDDLHHDEQLSAAASASRSVAETPEPEIMDQEEKTEMKNEVVDDATGVSNGKSLILPLPPLAPGKHPLRKHFVEQLAAAAATKELMTESQPIVSTVKATEKPPTMRPFSGIYKVSEAAQATSGFTTQQKGNAVRHYWGQDSTKSKQPTAFSLSREGGAELPPMSPERPRAATSMAGSLKSTVANPNVLKPSKLHPPRAATPAAILSSNNNSSPQTSPVTDFLQKLPNLRNAGAFMVTICIAASASTATFAFDETVRIEEVLKAVNVHPTASTSITLRKGSTTITGVDTTQKLHKAVFDLASSELRKFLASSAGKPKPVDGFVIAQRCQLVSLRASVIM